MAKHLKTNFDIIGLEYSLTNLHRIEKNQFIVYESKEEVLEKIFKDHKLFAVIHVATVYRRQGEPILNLIKTNINLPIRLAELATLNKVKIFINTDSFFNNSKYNYSYLSDYTLSKKHSLEWIKMLVKESTCKVVNMKIFHMFGENDAPGKFIPFIIDKLKNNEDSIALTLGEQTRDFIYVKDVVNAFGFVLKIFDSLETYQEFEVGTGKSYTLKELIELIKSVTNASTRLEFGVLQYRNGEIMESSVTNKNLFNKGWQPNFSLKQAIENCVRNG